MGISFRPPMTGSEASGSNQARPPIDPRFTFARKHVEDVCSDTTRVLAVDEIIRGLPHDIRASVDRRKLLEAFFFGDLPDTQVYMPVRVCIKMDREPSSRWDHLTQLIAKSTAAGARPGVLLSARSGAGKTIAAFKAFFDCFTIPQDGTEPALAGYLPCWMQLDTEAPHASIAQIIVRSFGYADDGGDDWLRLCPPLLLFLDLNVASTKVRVRLAEDLCRFQKEYKLHGHRCIVAYRTTQYNDAVATTLIHSGLFSQYDMERISVQAASTYLNNIRRYESAVREDVGLLAPEPYGAHTDCLCELIEQRSDEESPINTPLLIHFASLLTPREVSASTLAELYHCLVQHFLRREWRDHAATLSDCAADEHEYCDLFIIAMVRTALAMLNQGPNTTRLDRRTLDRAMREPPENPPMDDWRNPFVLCANTINPQFWNSSLYFSHTSGPSELRLLREHSLLRKDSGGFGFLHDSFLYYFAAYALRYYQGPESPTEIGRATEEWHQRVVARLAAEPDKWSGLPVRFLGGMVPDLEQAHLLMDTIVDANRLRGYPELVLGLLRGMGHLAAEDPRLSREMANAASRFGSKRDFEFRYMMLEVFCPYCGHVFGGHVNDSEEELERLRVEVHFTNEAGTPEEHCGGCPNCQSELELDEFGYPYKHCPLCPWCKTGFLTNEEGDAFCDECGHSLYIDEDGRAFRFTISCEGCGNLFGSDEFEYPMCGCGQEHFRCLVCAYVSAIEVDAVVDRCPACGEPTGDGG